VWQRFELTLNFLGELTYANGDNYNGDWVSDKMEGAGNLTNNQKVSIIDQMVKCMKVNGEIIKWKGKVDVIRNCRSAYL